MITMLRYSQVFVVLVMLVLYFTPGLALALEFTVEPRVNAGFKYYKFDVDGGFTFSDVMPSIGLGGTVRTDIGVFGDLYYQKAFGGNDSDAGFDVEWDRDELALTVGYALTENYAVFAGYKRAETNFDFTNIDFKADFTQDGPFLGGAYGWYINKPQWYQWINGGLSLNLALAFLNGDGNFETSGQNFPSTSGDTVGFKLGVAWKGVLLKRAGQGFLANGLNYGVALDGYIYDFDGDESARDSSERVLDITLSISTPIDL